MALKMTTGTRPGTTPTNGVEISQVVADFLARQSPEVIAQSPTKRTVVCWCDAGVKFFVVDRDLSHLHQRFMDSSDIDKAAEDEIYHLTRGKDGKLLNIPMSRNFPTQEVIDGALVVVTGTIL